MLHRKKGSKRRASSTSSPDFGYILKYPDTLRLDFEYITQHLDILCSFDTLRKVMYVTNTLCKVMSQYIVK